MCLAVPGKIVKINDELMADVDFGNLVRPVSLMIVPDALVGDWVLVHAGFALQVLNEEIAKETLDLIKEL
ncbi:MAG TPA: HypC/HybG/HupF family hydrogenase formation chaperone [Syntrophomonadaceae bacterium]|nr:HypC/HybG/HupF family hydrogenase formation chaperone [Syntrophomonadaceae bacterium]